MIALIFNELCECNFTKVSTVPIILLYYQFVKPLVHFRFLNFDAFEFVCELNNTIRMRKKT